MLLSCAQRLHPFPTNGAMQCREMSIRMDLLAFGKATYPASPQKRHEPSFREFVTLPFLEPLVLKPGESCGLYVHSSAMGDEAIAYDDYDNRRDIPREVPRSLPCGARTPSQPINQRTLAPQPTPKEGQEAETRDTRRSTGQFSAPSQGGGQGCIGRGGAPPPLSRAPSLCPATVSLNATARLNGDRQ